MNSILKNYHKINEIELNKRVAYYEQIDFYSETINLLIPDVVPYVRKIFNCLRWAQQNREIIEDICNQIVDKRISSHTLVQSIGYKVGNHSLDGRAHAQQNVHQYCRYIAETNDCVCQILNIVFALGYRQWERFEASNILSHENIKKHPDIQRLLKKFYNSIKLHKRFDNFDKHNLILWGHEKLSPESITNVEYYFTIDNQQHKMSDFINKNQEHLIKVTLVELLDNIFSLAKPENQPLRKYAHVLFDALIAETGLPVYTEQFLARDHIIQLKLNTRSEDNCIKVSSVSYYQQSLIIPSKIYLARLDQEVLACGTLQINNHTLDVNSFDVFQNNKFIGRYECTNREDQIVEYFHFKEYNFVQL